MYNRLEGNLCISNKKELFLNLMKYYKETGQNPQENIPLTFLLKKSKPEATIQEIEQFEFENDNTYWIVKPGEYTNRGKGIHVCCNIKEIQEYVQDHQNDRGRKTFIIQRYIHNPFLIHGRKFDIR